MISSCQSRRKVTTGSLARHSSDSHYAPRVPRVAALLAAGAGARFQAAEHKLLALLRGRPVWEWALDEAVNAGFDHVIVVTGFANLPQRPNLPTRPNVLMRHNPHWATGQAGSLQVAISAARDLGADAITLGLADQPFVTADAWRAVTDAAPEWRIAVATYGGEVGPNPVRLRSDVWPLLPTVGDAGARSLIREHPEWVCPVACIGSVADIDTLEDLARWNHC